MEQMNPLDAAFWDLEDHHAALHLGGIAVFAGPAPDARQLRDLVRHKLHRKEWMTLVLERL